MNYPRYLILMLSLCFMAHSFSIGGFNPEIVQHENGIEYIKLASQGGLCGSIYITPISGKDAGIHLEARLYDGNIFKEITGSAKLPHQGLNVRYDWAGFSPNMHYRIYTYKINENGDKEYTNPREYILIEHVKHNVGCVPGIAGPEVDYPPLNMNKA